MAKYRNNKNQKVYELVDWGVINATNGHEGDEDMVLYKDEDGRPFVRAETEFTMKFTKYE